MSAATCFRTGTGMQYITKQLFIWQAYYSGDDVTLSAVTIRWNDQICRFQRTVRQSLNFHFLLEEAGNSSTLIAALNYRAYHAPLAYRLLPKVSSVSVDRLQSCSASMQCASDSTTGSSDGVARATQPRLVAKAATAPRQSSADILAAIPQYLVQQRYEPA